MTTTAFVFDVLGTPAVIGRTFRDEDARPDLPTAAVVSYALWQTAFTGDPAVIGRTIGLGDRAATVIGVMPRGFGGLGQSFGSAGPELWLPLAQIDAIGREVPGWLSPPPRGQRYLRFVARMSDPVSLARVQSEANVLAWQVGAAREGSPNAFAEVVPLRMVDVSRIAPLMALVMLVPTVVLLIACVNAANLLPARASQRAREIAVRLAIGASRRRLIRQCLVESLVLAGVSSVCAVPAAWMVLRALESTTGIVMLATAGLYAVVSYMVASRSSEIAVRMALGAEPRTMLRMVLRQALTMTTIGGVIGGATAWAIGRGIQAEMHAAAGTDFKALGGAIAVLLLATLVAAVLPSIRAARINPVVLLREQ